MRGGLGLGRGAAGGAAEEASRGDSRLLQLMPLQWGEGTAPPSQCSLGGLCLLPCVDSDSGGAGPSPPLPRAGSQWSLPASSPQRSISQFLAERLKSWGGGEPVKKVGVTSFDAPSGAGEPAKEPGKLGTDPRESKKGQTRGRDSPPFLQAAGRHRLGLTGSRDTHARSYLQEVFLVN